MNGIRKHRGLKRYYRDLAVKNDFHKIDIGFETSDLLLDNWHLHFDNWGYGNKSFKRRKPHLDKLFRHFDILIEKTKNMKGNFQLYTVLLDYNSNSDALFLHTPNSDNSQFPFQISDLFEQSTLTNRALTNYIDQLTGYKKLYGEAEESFCILFKGGVGIDLRNSA